MSKRYDAALRIKPLFQKGAQILEDSEAFKVKGIYPIWETGKTYPVDYKVQHGESLYKCLQEHTSQTDWIPDATPALWAVIDETHAGTISDPIPAVRGMEYEYGLYYLDPEDSNIYLCQRVGETDGTTIVLQYMPHELVGMYFVLAE